MMTMVLTIVCYNVFFLCQCHKKTHAKKKTKNLQMDELVQGSI